MITLLCILIVVSLALVVVYSNVYVLRVELLDNHGAVKKLWSAHSLFGYLDFTVIKNPNVLSRVALMILPFVYLYYIDSPKKSVRIFMFMLFVSTMLLIFFTVSRSGIVVLVLSLFYLSYKFRSSLAYKISFSVLILAVVLLISDTVLSERFSKIASGNIQEESRYKLMVASLQSFQEHPLFGSGPGSLGYQLFKFTYLSGSRENFVMGHNLYLNILVETGLVGLLIFLTISFYLLKDIGAVESITLVNKDTLILKALNVSALFLFCIITVCSDFK